MLNVLIFYLRVFNPWMESECKPITNFVLLVITSSEAQPARRKLSQRGLAVLCNKVILSSLAGYPKAMAITRTVWVGGSLELFLANKS